MKNNYLSIYKFKQKISNLLLELFLQSGILVESHKNNNKLYALALNSNNSFYFLKIDQLLLYWRTFYIFLTFFFSKAKYKSQYFLTILRKISFVENFGELSTYYTTKDETTKRFRTLLDDYNILINLPIIFFINSPITPSFIKLRKVLDNANFLTIYLDPFMNYTSARNVFTTFNISKYKNTILYFLYKPSTLQSGVQTLFLNPQRKNATAVSDQIFFNYNPIEKNIIISLSEINNFDDYSVPGNLKSRYSFDFIYFLITNIIKFTTSTKKNKQIFFKNKIKKCA